MLQAMQEAGVSVDLSAGAYACGGR
jgi:hypothetical protein